MEIIIYMIIVLMTSLGLAKFESRFKRDEDEVKDGESIHWFKLAVGDRIVLPIVGMIIGNAKDLEAVYGYRLPERFLEKNLTGAIVSFNSEIPNGDWPFTKALITQQSLITDIVDILHGIAYDDGKITKLVSMEDVSQKTGEGTEADPEVDHYLEQWVPKEPTLVIVDHKDMAGTRTKYSGVGGQSSLD